jgi:hypothetical protein
MRFIHIFTAVLVVSGTLFGYGYYDSFTTGTPTGGLTSRATALGGLKAQPLGGPSDIFMNPGALGLLEDVSVSIDGGALRWTETVNGDIVTNRGGEALGAAAWAVAFPLESLVLAAGVAKAAEFDYAGTHNSFNTYSGHLDSVEVAYVSGSQWEYLAGISGRITEGIGAGFSGGLRTVNADYDYYFSDRTYGGVDSTAQWTVSEADFCWHGGLVTTSELASAGVSYTSGTDYFHPVLAFGGSVVSPHIGDTRTGFEAEIGRPFDKNDFTGKLFIESPLTTRFDIRAAVLFNEGYRASRTSVGFGLGGGYNLGSLDVSVGCLVNSRSRSGSAFPSEDAESVEDSSISLVFGSVYRF